MQPLLWPLAEILQQLNLSNNDWEQFVETSVLQYQIDIAKDRSRLTNPSEIIFVQRALNALIDAGLEEDGIWGSATERKVREFQRSRGLKDDGVVGTKTRALLQKEFSRAAMAGAD